VKTQQQYLEELVEEMGTGFVSYGEREFEELDYESMNAWDREQRDFTEGLLRWRKLRMMKKTQDEKFLQLTYTLHAQAFYWFNKGWLVSKATDRRYDKLEADMKTILRVLNLSPQAQEQGSEEMPSQNDAVPPKPKIDGIF
jgi:hypothetical protein